MSINFTKIPSDDIITKYIKIFGFKSIDDQYTIIYENELFFNNVDKQFQLLIDELNYYYKKKIKNITIKKCISIIKQFLKIKNMVLTYKYKIINKNKNKYFYITTKRLHNIKKYNHIPKMISFD